MKAKFRKFLIRIVDRLFPDDPPPSPNMIKHEIGGHVFYSFDNVLNLPLKRKIAYSTTSHDASLRVAGPDIDAFCSLVDEYVAGKDLAKIGFAVNLLRQYRDLYATKRTLFPIANCVVVMPGEPVDVVTSIWTRRKKEIFETDDQVADFFLTCAIEFVHRSPSQTDIINWLDYLKKDQTVRSTELIFSNLIRRHFKVDS